MLNLQVVTPSRTVLTEDVDSVTLPGTEGELGILPEHIPLVTTLDSGVMTYRSNGKIKGIAVHWGFAQVEGNRISVLAELAEKADEINLERANVAEHKAIDFLNSSDEDWEDEKSRSRKYSSKLKRAVVRQQVAKMG